MITKTKWQTKALPVLAILILFNSLAFGQSTDSLKEKHIVFNTYDELRAQQKTAGIDHLIYLDSAFNYEVQVPNWLQLKETGSITLFGGTLPEIDGIENAILIKGFLKSDFRSFDEFKEIYLTGNKFGQPARFSKEHIWYGQNALIKIDKGVKQKVFIFWQNRIYHNLFVLLETKSAYLWIQFSATPNTYDTNISKFDEFMVGFKILN